MTAITHGLVAERHENLLEQSLGRYLRESYSLAQRALVLKGAEGFSREHWAFFADLGLLGLPFDEANGGYGGSLSDVMSVMRLMGSGLVLEPWFDCVVVAGRFLATSTSEANCSTAAPK